MRNTHSKHTVSFEITENIVAISQECNVFKCYCAWDLSQSLWFSRYKVGESKNLHLNKYTSYDSDIDTEIPFMI